MSETKMYSVLDKWTDLDKENVVDFTSVDGVVTEARLNGVPVGGGGGGSATLTVNVESGAFGSMLAALYFDDVIDPEFLEVNDSASPFSFPVAVNSHLYITSGEADRKSVV